MLKQLTRVDSVLSKLEGSKEDRLAAAERQAQADVEDAVMTLEMVRSLQLMLGGQVDAEIADAVFGGKRDQLSSIQCLLDECCRSYVEGQHEDGVMLDDLAEDLAFADRGYCFNPSTARRLMAQGGQHPFTRGKFEPRPVMARILGGHRLYERSYSDFDGGADGEAADEQYQFGEAADIRDRDNQFGEAADIRDRDDDDNHFSEEVRRMLVRDPRVS